MLPVKVDYLTGIPDEMCEETVKEQITLKPHKENLRKKQDINTQTLPTQDRGHLYVYMPSTFLWFYIFWN